jgi:transposase
MATEVFEPETRHLRAIARTAQDVPHSQRLAHDGYYIDVHEEDLLVPIALISGHDENDDPTGFWAALRHQAGSGACYCVDKSETYDTLLDALYAADSWAERLADDWRTEAVKREAEFQCEGLMDQIAELRRAHSKLAASRPDDGLDAATCRALQALRENVADHVRDIKQLRAEPWRVLPH